MSSAAPPERSLANAAHLTRAALPLPDYAFPYIILVLSLVTLAVYMSASEVQVNTHTQALTAHLVYGKLDCRGPTLQQEVER